MDDFNSALIEAVKASGGSPIVGPKLWPEKTPQSAQRLLLDCLNDDRPARLNPDQVMFVLRLARTKGHHDAFAFMAASLGYAPPVPVEPRDEVAELQRQFISATEQAAQNAQRMAALVDRMEQMQQVRPSLRSAI